MPVDYEMLNAMDAKLNEFQKTIDVRLLSLGKEVHALFDRRNEQAREDTRRLFGKIEEIALELREVATSHAEHKAQDQRDFASVRGAIAEDRKTAKGWISLGVSAALGGFAGWASRYFSGGSQ